MELEANALGECWLCSGLIKSTRGCTTKTRSREKSEKGSSNEHGQEAGASMVGVESTHCESKSRQQCLRTAANRRGKRLEGFTVRGKGSVSRKDHAEMKEGVWQENQEPRI